MKLSKREWERLGPLMLPLRMGGRRDLPPKLATKALQMDIVEPHEERIYGAGNNPIDRTPIIVKGYRFTTMGHAQYCEWAANQAVNKL